MILANLPCLPSLTPDSHYLPHCPHEIRISQALVKKRIAARTSWKRIVRHSMDLKAPRGYGWLTKPRKAAYNRIYSRTSRGCLVSFAIAILFGVLIAAQIAWGGGHGSGGHSVGGTVHVSGYYRKDGTYVHPYDRAAAGYGSYFTPASRVYESTLPTISTTLPTTSTASPATAPRTATYVAAIPANAAVHAREYDRQDGTHVKEYVRSAPGYADAVVAVATSARRENQKPPKSSSSASTSVTSTNVQSVSRSASTDLLSSPKSERRRAAPSGSRLRSPPAQRSSRC